MLFLAAFGKLLWSRGCSRISALSTLSCLSVLVFLSPHLAVAEVSDAFDFVLEPGVQHVVIGEGMEVLEDASHRLDLEAAKNTRHWQVLTESVLNRSFSASVWWMRFQLQNQSDNRDWILEIGYPLLDHIHIYKVNPDDGHSMMELVLGDKQPFDNRPIIHRNFLMPIVLEPGERVQIYLSVESAGTVKVPISVWQTSHFHVVDVIRVIIEGVFFGGLLSISLYNLFLYVALGERSYLYYVGWVASIFMFIAALHGWLYQFLWPKHLVLNKKLVELLLVSAVIFAHLFVWTFLKVFDMPKIIRLLNYFGGLLCGVMTLGIFMVEYRYTVRLIPIFILFSCANGVFTGIVARWRGDTAATIYLLAWGMLLLSAIVTVLSIIHVIPNNLVTDSALQIGSLLEVLLLSFALAERINTERSMRITAQQQALRLQRQTNEELERRVADRTLALEKANEKLKALSTTDSLTGLKNRRFLDQFLANELERARQCSEPLAVLLIDVDFFKSVNDQHGHQVGDECLHMIATRLSANVNNEFDVVARYGGEEFCVVLPNTAHDIAYKVAERLRNRVESKPIINNKVINEKTVTLNVTISVGLVADMPQEADQHVDVWFRYADEALYQAKEQGRNRVICSDTKHAGIVLPLRLSQ